MTYNVFSGTLNPTQSINQSVSFHTATGRHNTGELASKQASHTRRRTGTSSVFQISKRKLMSDGRLYRRKSAPPWSTQPSTLRGTVK